MSLHLLEIFGILIVGLLAYIEAKRYHLSRKYRHVKGVKEVPILGSKYSLRPSSMKDIKILFNKIHFSKLNKIFIAHKLVFIVSDPDILQQILTGSNWIERPFFFDFFRTKYGLLTAKYHQWKPVRKAANPAFSMRMSLSFIPIFEKQFRTFADELQKFVQSQATFDVNKLSMDTGKRVILETNFGVTNADERFFSNIFEKFENNITRRLFSPLVWPEFIYQHSKLAKSDELLHNTAKELFHLMLMEREQYWQGIPNSEDAVNRGRLFIDEIIEHSESGLYDKDEDMEVLIDNLLTIFVAGFETSALTVSYAILLLAMHPEIDAKVEKEIFENYQPGEPITQDTLRNMTYLDKVIREVLRLYPPAAISARQNMKDTQLVKIGSIPKDTVIVISYYNLHRWKDVWGDDADEFNPEHFSEENNAKRHPYAYLPFSGGPKICIGYQYAMINIKVGLVTLLSQYKFSTEQKMNDLKYKFSVTLKLANKHMVKVHPRHYKS